MSIHDFTPSPEADAEGVCHTDKECALLYAEINPDIKARACAMLAEELKGVREPILKVYHKEGDGWITGYHFGWGMAVRNLLRKAGFGEEALGVHNLDCVYVHFLVDALHLNDS